MLCLILIVGGLLIMMGQHTRSEPLFYYFRLEDQVIVTRRRSEGMIRARAAAERNTKSVMGRSSRLKPANATAQSPQQGELCRPPISRSRLTDTARHSLKR